VTKLLLIGRGQIGQALASDLTGFDIHVWPHDLDDLSTHAIEVIAPDIIVNAAGKTNLAWCEANAREAVRSNLEAPVRLYTRLLEYDSNREDTARYIHFSSGCIWDGPYTEDGKPFTPDVPPTPACLYSWTKAAADAMLMGLDPDNIAILRPRQVYSSSSSPRNTLVKLMQYPKLVDTPNSVSSVATIAKTVAHVATASENWSGIWNVYDRGIMTPFEIGKLLAAEGLRDEPMRISKDELDQFHTPKRVDTVLYDARFEEAIQPSDVMTELRTAIKFLKEKL
jgi:dTDP-4-dehydrorhamnose reductase